MKGRLRMALRALYTLEAHPATPGSAAISIPSG
jgi:hypothetical protein